MASGSSAASRTTDMPRLLPSRAGLTTARGPMRAPMSASTASGSSVHPLRRNQVKSTTGRPWPRMRSLKTILSMATALAITPAPVYGMPASSRKPCSVPSSPNGPWITRKATSIASASERSAARGASASVLRDDRQGRSAVLQPARCAPPGCRLPAGRPGRSIPARRPGRRAGASAPRGRCRPGTARSARGRWRAGPIRPTRRSPRARPTGRRRRCPTRSRRVMPRPSGASQSPTNSIS